MPYIIASPPKLIRCLVRREFTQNFEEGFGEYLPAEILAIRAIPALSLQFQVRFNQGVDAGAMFVVPIQAICFKPHKPIDYGQEVIQPWDTFSSEFCVHEIDLLKNSKGWILNKIDYNGLPARIESKYLFTLDFTGNALADDFEQHKHLHLVHAKHGFKEWLAALPNNRWISDDSAFAKVGDVLPRYKSLSYNFSAECEIGLPKG